MNQFGAMAVKVFSGGATAVLMTLGVTAGLADASVTPAPAPASSNAAVASPLAGVRDAVRFAVFEAEADVLRIPQAACRVDLKRGITVARLARERGLNKDQFGDRLVVNVKPRLAQLVHLRVVTKAQADIVIDRIQRGNIPWWNGVHI
jgi:uncharacterized protein YpuA (DUF1002 family)